MLMPASLKVHLIALLNLKPRMLHYRHYNLPAVKTDCAKLNGIVLNVITSHVYVLRSNVFTTYLLL